MTSGLTAAFRPFSHTQAPRITADYRAWKFPVGNFQFGNFQFGNFQFGNFQVFSTETALTVPVTGTVRGRRNLLLLLLLLISGVDTALPYRLPVR